MGFQMSEFEFQTFLFLFRPPPPYWGKRPKFSRFLIMMPPLSKVSWSPPTLYNKTHVISFKPRTPKIMVKYNVAKLVNLRNNSASNKDQNAMKLLLFLGVEFFFTNIPMAIGKIAISFGYKEEPVFKEFVVLSIILEVSFAASNFYLYCLCNSQIRMKVK